MIILKKTVLFSIIHMLVDGLCAFTMAAVSPSGNAVISAFIVYNFCAFVLQMPIGAVIDGLISRSDNHKLPLLFSIYGSVITLAGSLILIFLPGTILTAYSGVIVLGIGNAMFHVGGGVGSIIEDHINNKKGQNLGLFVAPGALGLYLGAKLLTLNPIIMLFTYMIIVGIIIFLLNKAFALTDLSLKYKPVSSPVERRDLILIICCFIVVVLRSYIGFSVSMPWKTGTLLPLLAVICIVLGKFGGGVLAARFDVRLVISVTLIICTIGYAFIDIPMIGLITLFLFNTTMPITLYLLVNRFKNMPGLYFGFLTVALFAGYVPSALSLTPSVNNRLIGIFGCIVSLILLLAATVSVSKKSIEP